MGGTEEFLMIHFALLFIYRLQMLLMKLKDLLGLPLS